MTFGFNIPDPPIPPVVDPWTSYFDDTNWAEDFKGVWNGAQNRWESVDNQLYIVTTGAWYVAYRPSKIRVTYQIQGGSNPDGMNIDLWDNCSTWTPSLTDPGGTYPVRDSLEEMTIVAQGADFCELDMVASTLEFYVTNIEFLA